MVTLVFDGLGPVPHAHSTMPVQRWSGQTSDNTFVLSSRPNRPGVLLRATSWPAQAQVSKRSDPSFPAPLVRAMAFIPSPIHPLARFLHSR